MQNGGGAVEINTKVLLTAENDFRLYRNQIERINDEARLVMLKVSSLKGIDEISLKLRRICSELDTSSHLLSQMSCFLEMANETYNRNEERIADKRDSIYRKISVFSIDNKPTVTSFPRYADTLLSKTTFKCYRIQNLVIKEYLNDIKKFRLMKSQPDLNNQVVKIYRLRNKAEILSVLSTIGKIW